MRRRKNAHIRSKHAPIPNCHNTAVQDGQVEVRIEALAEADVAAVVNVEGRLDADVVVAEVANDGFEQLEALAGHNVEAGGWVGGGVGEPGVEVMREGAGFEPCGFEVWGPGVVAGFD